MVRITGMFSGLDTDRIIQELVKNQKTKVDNAKKSQTSVQWKQDAWKALNTKALALFRGPLSTMRFSDAYAKKTSTVSNPTKATVVTGGTAVNGVQTLEINQLAKSGYMTGKKITTAANGKVSMTTRLSALGIDEGTISVKVGTKAATDINVNGNMTVQSLVNTLKGAGVNANFDVDNGRLFISSTSMGSNGSFTITAKNDGGLNALDKLGINFHDVGNYGHLGDIAAILPNGFDDELPVADSEEEALYFSLIKDEIIRLEALEQDKIDANKATIKGIEDNRIAQLNRYKKWLVDNDHIDQADADLWNWDNPLHVADVFGRMEALYTPAKTALDTQQGLIDAKTAEIETALGELADMEDIPGYEDDPAYIAKKDELTGFQSELAGLRTALPALQKAVSDIGYTYSQDDYAADGVRITNLTTENTTYAANIENSNPDNRTGPFAAEAEANIRTRIAFAQRVVGPMAEDSSSGVNGGSYVAGQNAEIFLNGVRFTSSSNTFSVNGLTINALQTTTEGPITITTEDDTQGIYDMVKNFIKEYNILINEMDRLYNAESAGSYKPLTDEEKESLSEKEIEKWEDKIKESLLRRDSSLSRIANAMKMTMMNGVTVGGTEVNGVIVGGTKMYLSTFGIDPLSYFAAEDNEKNAYYIDGEDNEKANLLLEAIAKDPKKVTDFFIGLTRNLYATMNSVLMDRNGDFKSMNTIYNDKQLKKEYDKLQNEIAKQEERLTKLEDKYYKQFSAMEVAMAKLQSSQTALSGLLGMGYNNN